MIYKNNYKEKTNIKIKRKAILMFYVIIYLIFIKSIYNYIKKYIKFNIYQNMIYLYIIKV
jgi:hypothetical protein